jgi:hypothetical protein
VIILGIVYLTTNNLNSRKYIGVDSNNSKYYFGSGKSIKLALKKYGSENFSKEILEESNDIDYLFEREKYYINLYDAVNSKEFYNMSEGGKGGSGTLVSDDSKERHRIGSLKGLQTVIKNRKGKTYSEIYGDKAEEEKEKRRLAGLGKKYSEERINKVSEALKGKIPWNKGLKGSQMPWNKGLDGFRIKIYILITPEENEITFKGRKELKLYIKQINSTLSHRSRINADILIKNKTDKNYKVKLK